MSTAASCCTRTPIGETTPVAVQKIADLDTFITDNKDSKTGIVLVYDIFGFYPQTLEGARKLAAQTGAVTFVPDFLDKNYVESDWIPPNTPEKQTKLQGFFANHGAPPLVLPKVHAWIKQAKAEFPHVEKWGIFGLCWGGKIAVLLSGEGSEFVVSGQTHPGLYDATDAKNAVIPHVVLASKDEDSKVTDEYNAIFMGEKSHLGSYATTYPTMHHGWMGARAKLDDEENKAEYERGYKEAATFFAKYL